MGRLGSYADFTNLLLCYIEESHMNCFTTQKFNPVHIFHMLMMPRSRNEFTVIVTCNSLKNRVVAVPSHSVQRRHPKHVNLSGYPFGRDREAMRFQALDAMLDWLEHFASISCITPRDNGGSFLRPKA